MSIDGVETLPNIEKEALEAVADELYSIMGREPDSSSEPGNRIPEGAKDPYTLALVIDDALKRSSLTHVTPAPEGYDKCYADAHGGYELEISLSEDSTEWQIRYRDTWQRQPFPLTYKRYVTDSPLSKGRPEPKAYLKCDGSAIHRNSFALWDLSY